MVRKKLQRASDGQMWVNSFLSHPLAGRGRATIESEDKFLRVNSLPDRWFTGQQLPAELNSGPSEQVSVSTRKRTLELQVWQVEMQQESHCKDVRITKRGLPGPWTPADRRLKAGRGRYGQMNQNVNSLLHPFAVEWATGSHGERVQQLYLSQVDTWMNPKFRIDFPYKLIP